MSPPPRGFSNRALFEEDRRNQPQLGFPKLDRPFSDYRPDSWKDPPRAPLEPPHRHRDDHRRVSPYRPTDAHNQDLERISSVFRDEFVDGYGRDNTNNTTSSRISQSRPVLRGGPRNDDHDDHSYRRQRRSPDRYLPDSKRFTLDLDFGVDSQNISSLSPTQDFGGTYKSRYGSLLEKERSWNRRDEDRRWFHDTMKNDDFGSRDETPFASDREDFRIHESGKFCNRSREGREGFHQSSPMKQVQKKSVLLRIGKPNNTNRNRSHDHHFSKAYADNSDTSNFRGKDKERECVTYLDQRIEEEREGSPVELDVSFKSNALVAKAIVAPSSPAVASDSYVTPPRNRKIRRITGSDSPLTRVNEQSVKSDSSSHGSDCPSSSEKTLKQLAEKGDVCGDGSAWTNDFTRNTAVEFPSDVVIDQGGNGGRCDKPLIHSGRKRKKALLLAPDASMQWPTKKDGEPVKYSPSALDRGAMHVKGDNYQYSPFALDEGAMHVKGDGYKYSASALDEGAMQDVSFPSLNESFVNEMEKSPQAIVQGKDGTDSPCALDSKSKDMVSHDLPSSSNPLLNKIDQIPENSDISAPDFQFNSNSETILTQFQSGSTVCNIDRVEDVNMQPCQNGVPLLLENDNAKVSSDCMVSQGDNDNSVLSSQEENLIHEGSIGSYAFASSTFNGPRFFNGSLLRKESSTTVDMGSSDFKKSCLNELMSVPPENGVVEGSSNVFPVNADETEAPEGDMNVDCCKQDSSTTSYSNSGPTNPQAEKIVSDAGIIGDTSMQSCFDGATRSHENDPVERSPLPTVLADDSPSASSSKGYSPNAKRERRGLDMQLGSSSPRVSEMPENMARPMLDKDATLNRSLKGIAFDENRDSGSRGDNAIDFRAVQEHDSRFTETANLNDSSAMEIFSPDQTLPRIVIESHMLVKDDLPHPSNILSACAADSGLSAAEAGDECMPDMLINLVTVTSEKVSTSSGSCMLNNKSLDCVTSNQKFSKDDNNLHQKPVSGSGSVLPSSSTSANNLRSNMNSSHSKPTDVATSTKTASSVSQSTNKTTQSLTSRLVGLNMAKNQPTSASAVPRVFTGRSPAVFTNSRTNAPAKQIAKPRTWYRSSNASVSPLPAKKSFSIPVSQPPKKVGMGQSSYIRSGNTLVRKPAAITAIPNVSPALSSSVYRLNPSGIDETKKSAGSGSKVDVIGTANSLKTGLTAPIERPKTPPLLHSTKSSDCKPVFSGDVTSSPLENPPLYGSEIISNPVKLTEHLALPKVPEDNLKSSGVPEQHTGLTRKSENQNIQEGNLGKKMRYVKRKSNQLVAASNIGDQSVQDVDKTQASLSDGYYKRRKNQLIRTPAVSLGMQRVTSPDDPICSEMQRAPEVNSSRSFIKKLSGKGKAKMYKHSRFSSVWTLNNQSSRKHGLSLQCQKVWPHLIPWKRAKDWRSFINMSASISKNSSLSLISRKLLLSRKRDTIYTRSPHGFSLRMSKLLSVGGSSLKWSKSIERNSKRANEEATLAVAAVEKEKREQNGATQSVVGPKSRNNISRERIFRIGLVRYRMDPSRRTLQRISGDEEPSTSLQSKREGKRTYVPRRLLIGHDEYVRIGNGNQLVRDPKKRTRIFANEKVRWSLHTARLRLARKRKYCQFFTRFGKCNKDGGKCPYIHDPSKIAVCTKFLNGSCSDPSCKLTHKVIPERMQDCSYFVQGLCSNEHCPYRHVNVNTNASVCEGFLKGYCADGNECRKKHTYVCPVFEATGICPQGSTCKLHHPKNRSSGSKRKQQSREQQQKNARGRYFGSNKRHAGVVAECVVVSPVNQGSKDDEDIFFQEGKFSDYINLDVSDEETGGTCDLTSEQRTTFADPSDVQLADMDELTKPIRIMNKNLVTDLLLACQSPSEKSASFLSEESDVCK